MIRSIISTLTAIVFCFGFSNSQNNLSQLFAQGEFQDCLQQSQEIIQDEDQNATANFFAGASCVRLQKYDQAVGYLLSAIELGYTPALPVNANLLRSYAGVQETAKLLELLESLTNSGFSAYGFMSQPEFGYLEGLAAYEELKTAIHQNANPCLYGDVHKALDFWVGDWNVYVSGNKIAESQISKSISGCILYEDYRTIQGFVGQSTNYYDQTDSLYTQIWIDGANNLTIYKADEDSLNYLRMVASNSANRMTWTYDKAKDEVLQVVESTTDNGQSWSKGFVGTYKRKRVAISESIENNLRTMEQLFANDNMEGVAAYYTDDAQIFEPGGKIFRGAEEIKEYWRGLSGKGISWTLEVEDAKLDAENPSTVVISTLKHRLSGRDESVKTRALLLWKKTGTHYKIHRDFFHETQ